MKSDPEPVEKTLPPPWDRIFSLTTKAFVWGLLIAVLYVLRPFLLLVFLTFVFAYIQAHGVDGLVHRIKNRPARVIIVGLVFLGTLFATGFTLAPEIQQQAKTFWENRQRFIDDADRQLDKTLRTSPTLHASIAKHREQGPRDGDKPRNDKATSKDEAEAPEQLHIVRDVLTGVGESLAKNPLEIGQSVIGYASSFLLSLLFSFLIVLDLPRLNRSIRGLSKTKIGFIYDEVADNIAGFGRVLGRALEAQLFIAICNTILTAIGLWMLGLTSNLLVLSAIVFFCSFIPVAGTFISSTPICLLALQSGGVTLMVLAIALICIIHALETYVLNPQIYGHHMHMNPVLVLIVLTIGGKLFGVWGLLLGIPIVNYVFRHAIRRPEERPAEA